MIDSSVPDRRTLTIIDRAIVSTMAKFLHCCATSAMVSSQCIGFNRSFANQPREGRKSDVLMKALKFRTRAFAATCAFMCIRAAAATCEEGFENVALLVAHGWEIRNNSAPLGRGEWTQGDADLFPAFEGPADSYVRVGADSAAGPFPVVSNWLVSPIIDFGP